MHKFFILVLATLVISCKEDNKYSVSFEIINKSDQAIEQVDFFAGVRSTNTWFFSDSIKFTKKIDQDSNASFIWENPKLDKSDGSFYIKVHDLETAIGYYSNGIILDGYSKYKLNIYNDSIK